MNVDAMSTRNMADTNEGFNKDHPNHNDGAGEESVTETTAGTSTLMSGDPLSSHHSYSQESDGSKKRHSFQSSGDGSRTSSSAAYSEAASSALRRKSELSQNNNTARILVSSHERHKKELLRKSTEGFTINKLKISELGLIGRDTEQQTLLECLARVSSSNNKSKSSSSSTSTSSSASSASTGSDSIGENNPATRSSGDSGQSTNTELVLIGGQSGSGKSVLAKSIEQKVLRLGGGFVHGKFENNHHNGEPYTAIGGICREIIGQLLMESTDIQTLVGQKLFDELGNELLEVLINAVPEIDELLIPRAATTPTSYNTPQEQSNADRGNNNNTGDSSGNNENGMTLGTMSQQQLNHAFRLFIRVICSTQYQPLVMLIDDLQWADMASLEVMEVWITDHDNESGLLIVGCYRSNEVDETHIFSKCRHDLIEKSRQQGGRGGQQYGVTEMELGNFNLKQVNQVIMALLSIDDDCNREGHDRTTPLAKICHQRTQGNPFFIISFLSLLNREEYLHFNLGTFQWTWDVTKIEEETASTDNVVEMMMKQINGVNQDLGKLLQIASLLGSEFDNKILFLVWHKLCRGIHSSLHSQEFVIEDDSKLIDYLKEAMDRKFIESIGPTSHRWVHDKVQEAALSLLPESEQPTFQFDVGMILLRNLDSQARDSLCFIIVNLLNAKECSDEGVNIEIARLSVKATNKARTMSAFSSMAKYAGIGIQHLPAKNDEKWKTYYDLTLELYCAAVQSESVLGKTDNIKDYADAVLDNGRSILDKVSVYYVLAASMAKMGRFVDANKYCIDAINQLKCVKIGNGLVLTVKTVSGLLSTKKLLASVNADNLPFMADPKQIATMKLLDLLASYSFQANNILLLLFATIKMVRLTVKHGISNTAPSAFAQYGALVFGILNDMAAGARIGEMALGMVKRLNGQANEALVVARTWGFTLSYSQPLHQGLKQFLHGYSEGMKFGDTEMSSWCLYNHASCSFIMGKKLKTIAKDCQIYVPYIQDLGWTEVCASTRYVLLSVQYLLGDDDEEASSSNLFKDVEGEPAFAYNSKVICKSAAYTYSGNYEEGADLGLKIGDAIQKAAPGHLVIQSDVFTRGVCFYAMAHKTNKAKYKKAARAVLKNIKTWEQQGSVNSKHHMCLLNAEEEALRKNLDKASNLYREGIVGAARRGCLRDAGLLNERYANFSLHYLKDDHQAKHHAEESIKYYTEWGAQRTVDTLKSKYAELFESVPSSVPLSIGIGSDQVSSHMLGLSSEMRCASDELS